MKISLIVAATKNNAIGKNNELLWHLPNDMKYFKNTTWGMPIIMGRKTFESMNNKILNGRINIVVSRNSETKSNEAVIVSSIKDALFVANQTECNEVFIIGGGEIYKELFPKADKIYLTRVDTVLDADTFFPEIEEKKWNLVYQKNMKADEKHAYDYSFEIWEKI
jgi:dihydrofolate reductase